MSFVRTRRDNLHPVSVAANCLGQIAPFSSGPKVIPGMASVPQEPCRGLPGGGLSHGPTLIDDGDDVVERLHHSGTPPCCAGPGDHCAPTIADQAAAAPGRR